MVVNGLRHESPPCSLRNYSVLNTHHAPPRIHQIPVPGPPSSPPHTASKLNEKSLPTTCEPGRTLPRPSCNCPSISIDSIARHIILSSLRYKTTSPAQSRQTT